MTSARATLQAQGPRTRKQKPKAARLRVTAVQHKVKGPRNINFARSFENRSGQGRFSVQAMAEEAVPERTVRAVVLPCGKKGTFKGEVYEQAVRVQSDDKRSTPGFFFWILRWIVDFLGGTPTRNFAGRSRDAMVCRTATVLADGLSSSETEQDEPEASEEGRALPSGESHVTLSGMMTMQERSAKKRKSKDQPVVKEESAEPAGVKEELDEDSGQDEGDEADLVRRSDFSMSSFACLCWLANLMSKGPRANSKWNLESGEVRSRAEALLEGMRDSFWQDVRGRGISVVAGVLSVEQLAAAYGQVVPKIFAKRKNVCVVEAMRVLQADSTRRSLSQDRRRLAEKVFSRLLVTLAEAIDQSKGQAVWTAHRVESLEQLRTAPET